jgi:antitoxin (DNA-binding transcriptional repressor) of toxin-antitoxin stability system
MKQFNICAAKTQLSKLVDLANKGESFIIAMAGTPLATLAPLAEPAPKKKIKYGLMKDKVKFAPDFDDPLPDWLLDAFEAKAAAPREEY